MNYYNEIKNKLIDNEIYQNIKDYSKEKHKVITYFEIGKLLYTAGSKYGDSIIDNYSAKLMIEVGKKYNSRTLRSMRQLYSMFNYEIWKPLVSKLSWTHLLLIMPLKDQNSMLYYAKVSIQLNLSKRQLQEKIKNKEYERLDDNIKSKLDNFNDFKINDLIKNPVFIKNSYNYKIISENILKKLILEDMDNFLTELGSGFCYIKNEYKIKLGDRYNYIDLLLFNIKFNCYIVVELKVSELKSQHIGQIQKHMNYIDKNIKTIIQNDTIGIIICKIDNKFVMEYCSDPRIFSTSYLLN